MTSASCGDKRTVAAFASTLDEFWATGTRSWLKSSHASFLTNLQSTVPPATARDRTRYIRGSPQHLTTEHQKLIAPTLNLSMERMDRRKTPAMKRVRVHVSPDGRYSTQCTTNSHCARTSLDAGQQNEMTIDDTWPRTGEMRSLWMCTTEFWTNDMPQDDTWQTPHDITATYSRSFAII